MSLATPTIPRKIGIRSRVTAALDRHRGMSIGEACRVALEGLAANKMRSFLTMLGVIIGVGSVVVMIALGQGAAQATQAAIAQLGTNVLTVMPNSQISGGVSQGLGSAQNMKLSDVDAIRKYCPSVAAVSAEYRGSGTVKFKQQNTRTSIQGGMPEYFPIHNIPLAQGRAFTTGELRSRAKVAVIGDNIRETLFGSVSPVGKYLKINGQNFRVVGVAERRGAGGFRSPDDQVTIPVTTAMFRLFGADYLNSISVQAVSTSRNDEAQAEVLQALARAHRQKPGAEPEVRIFSQADLLESANQQSSFLTMLLAGIALVSLVVGGIGIMNIMLVSVSERTHEIGIRKAVGARRRDILSQFLIEAVTLSLLGGLLGIAGAVGVGYWMALPAERHGLGFPILFTPTPMIVAFAFSAVVGIFFGIYPALKAASLDPIKALQYE
jgi:ABC-type antimicrobial peptide transport system permease subunit